MRTAWIHGMMMTGALALAGGTALACPNCAAHGQGMQMAMARPADVGVAGQPAAPEPDVAAQRAAVEQKAERVADKAEKELKPQQTCPVMDGPIDKNLYVDHEGKRIYVCCAGCLAPVKADPAAAIAKLAEKGEAPVKVVDAEKAAAKREAPKTPAAHDHH